MTDHKPFEAKESLILRAELSKLVEAYDSTPGSSGPYACPQALASFLDAVCEDALECIELCGEISIIELMRLRAAQLRGES
jgi:hypothetical protein